MDRDTIAMFVAWLVRSGDSRGEALILISIGSIDFQTAWSQFTVMKDFENVKNKFLESVKL